MKKSHKALLIILLLSIVLLTFGGSYAFFQYIEKGNTINVIETGNLIFRYDEGQDVGNGILLTNALPMSDEEGKVLKGVNQVFDFQIFTNIMNSPVEYQIIADKQADSTLKDEYIKVYLTTVAGEVESPVAGMLDGAGKIIRFSDLTETNYPGQTGKVIYKEAMNNKATYSRNYRLRMWVAEDTDVTNPEFLEKRFAIKVNVYAQSI